MIRIVALSGLFKPIYIVFALMFACDSSLAIPMPVIDSGHLDAIPSITAGWERRSQSRYSQGQNSPAVLKLKAASLRLSWRYYGVELLAK